MTTQERLRDAAQDLRKHNPRPRASGEYLDELLDRAAKEIDGLYRLNTKIILSQTD